MDFNKRTASSSILPYYQKLGLGEINRKSSFYIAVCVISTLFPIIVPYIHFGLVSQLWDKYTYIFNKRDCRCYCWDTIFKGKSLFLKNFNFSSIGLQYYIANFIILS